MREHPPRNEMRQDSEIVSITNSTAKPGPKETPTGVLFALAQQAYWGFRFLQENRPLLWVDILEARTIAEIQDMGAKCEEKGTMKGAGFVARQMMQRLQLRSVARQILKAKRDKARWPSGGRQDRKSSNEKRLLFLSVATAAGMHGREYSTALRKLAQAGLGLEHLARRVHHFDGLEKRMREMSFLYAEPVGNYFCEGRPIGKLPCPIPENCTEGFILYGYTESGFTAGFSPTLPADLSSFD